MLINRKRSGIRPAIKVDVQKLILPDEAPPTPRRPELSAFWANLMKQYPEVL
jgi:hypothetical protein